MAHVPTIGHSAAVPADNVALDKDIIGFTHPNLHRRINVQSTKYECRQITSGEHSGKIGLYLEDDSGDFEVLVNVYESYPRRKDAEEAVRQFFAAQLPPGELKPRNYELFISGTHSYRTTEIHTHDDDSTTTELP